MHLLKAARQRANVLESFRLHRFNRETEHKLVKLLNRDFLVLTLSISFAVVLFIRVLVPVQAQKAYVIRVFVVYKLFDLLSQLLCLRGSQNLEVQTVR